MKRSFSRGLLVSANYMWSHEIDDGSDGSGDGDSLVPQNVACPKCERASGIWDARNVFNANAVYDLPLGLGKPFLSEPGIVNAIVGNWQFTSTAVARTGFPVNVLVNRSAAQTPDGNTNDQRPDLGPAVSLTPPGGKASPSGSTPPPSPCPRTVPGRLAAERGPWARRMADRHGHGEADSVHRKGKPSTPY